MSGLRTSAVALVAFGVGFALATWFHRPAPHGRLIKTLGRVSSLPADDTPSASTSHATDIERWSLEELRVRYSELLVRERGLQRQLAAGRSPGANGTTPPGTPGTPGAPTQPTAAPPQAPDVRRREPPNPLKETFYPTTPERLAELARECSVRVDSPPALESTPGDLGNVSEKLHVSPAEERVMTELLGQLHRSVRGELASFYEEVVGHAPSPELSSRALLSEIFDKTPASERSGAMERIARERAGELPPRDLSTANAYERSQRVQVALGDRYQALLAEKLGAARASELRATQGGWPWSRSVFTGCN